MSTAPTSGPHFSREVRCIFKHLSFMKRQEISIRYPEKFEALNESEGFSFEFVAIEKYEYYMLELKSFNEPCYTLKIREGCITWEPLFGNWMRYSDQFYGYKDREIFKWFVKMYLDRPETRIKSLVIRSLPKVVLQYKMQVEEIIFKLEKDCFCYSDTQHISFLDNINRLNNSKPNKVHLSMRNIVSLEPLFKHPFFSKKIKIKTSRFDARLLNDINGEEIEISTYGKMKFQDGKAMGEHFLITRSIGFLVTLKIRDTNFSNFVSNFYATKGSWKPKFLKNELCASLSSSEAEINVYLHERTEKIIMAVMPKGSAKPYPLPCQFLSVASRRAVYPYLQVDRIFHIESKLGIQLYSPLVLNDVTINCEKKYVLVDGLITNEWEKFGQLISRWTTRIKMLSIIGCWEKHFTNNVNTFILILWNKEEYPSYFFENFQKHTVKKITITDRQARESLKEFTDVKDILVIREGFMQQSLVRQIIPR